MGPRTASSCCCQARNLPWAPTYRLLMLLPGPESLMGPCTASHCCCLHRHTLPCATFRSPHTAGGFHFVIGCWQITGLPLLPRPLICHGPLYRLLMLLPGPESVMGPCTASPIAAVSIATLCHVPLSGLLTLLVGSILS
ncbi:unnamed protein product [Staurois parvus]|uniref:Uncharacterized protein n=2 Tax=Staurois parvus TaxID=386267 RepID=A0ABN9EIK8_9NEOB|nr:unnamed protein product [Staurois parvus]